MKKSILNLGKALNKAEQKKVTGGSPKLFECLNSEDCNNVFYDFGLCRNNVCFYWN